MAFHEGEIYRCQETGCGCELTVTKAAPADCTCEAAPTCCCGTAMVKAE
ncbi:hypothetical protein ACFYV5_09770 [Streptomyces sp. NPDC003035]